MFKAEVMFWSLNLPGTMVSNLAQLDLIDATSDYRLRKFKSFKFTVHESLR